MNATDRFDGSATPGSGTPNAALDRAYAYDPIGNRTAYGEGTGATKYYCSNELTSTRRSTTTAATARRRAERMSRFRMMMTGI